MIKIESLKDIDNLIKDGIEEGPTLDYKQDINNKNVPKAICAFANTIGGVLVLGVVEERRKIVKLKGIDPDGVEERIGNLIRDSIRPVVNDFKIKVFPLESVDKCIVVVEIAESLDAPHMWGHRYYTRRSSKSDPMEDHEVKAIQYGKGIRTALVEELAANLDMAKKYHNFYEHFLHMQEKDRMPVMLIPFHDDAWKALISSGYLLYLNGDLIDKLRNAYALVHEVNALSDFSRIIPGQPAQVGNLMVQSVIQTPAEDKFNHGGTYIFSVIETKIVQIISALTNVQSVV